MPTTTEPETRSGDKNALCKGIVVNSNESTPLERTLEPVKDTSENGNNFANKCDWDAPVSLNLNRVRIRQIA